MTVATLLTISNYLETALNANTTLNSDIFYGDQAAISGPRTICIEPNVELDVKTKGASALIVTRTISIYFLIYVNRLVNAINNRKESDALADDLKEFLYKRPRCGGLTYTMNIDNSESGFVTKNNGTTYAVRRLTVTYEAQVILPNPED